MTMVTDSKRRDEITRLVERTLEPLQPKTYRLKVMDVLEEGDWTYVIVQPDVEGVRSYDYYDALARVEEKLQDELKLNVLMVPTVPE
jgi:hypothetical protein